MVSLPVFPEWSHNSQGACVWIWGLRDVIAVFKKKKNHKGGSLVQLSWCPFIRGSTARVLAVSLSPPSSPNSLCASAIWDAALCWPGGALASNWPYWTTIRPQEWRKYNFRRSHPSLWDNAMAGKPTGQQTSEILEWCSLLFLVEKTVFGLETLLNNHLLYQFGGFCLLYG